jgi:hypothetical protein
MNGSAYSQLDSIVKAITIVQDTSMLPEIRTKIALEVIEKAILHPSVQKNAFAWFAKGVIYKEWYKTFEINNKKSSTRISALESFKRALEMDTSKGKPITITGKVAVKGGELVATISYSTKDIKQNINFLAARLYNDAAELLEIVDTTSISDAIHNFELFKEYKLLAEPTYNIKYFEINFKTVLADKYAIIFRKDIHTYSKFFGIAETTYKQVIALDTNNWSANYNLAMLYYNYGVDIINSMSVTEDLVVVENIQEEAKSLFKKALPYALKAYSLNPKKREVLVCLQGIYFSLYEFEKSEEFKAKVELLDKEK